MASDFAHDLLRGDTLIIKRLMLVVAETAAEHAVEPRLVVHDLTILAVTDILEEINAGTIRSNAHLLKIARFVARRELAKIKDDAAGNVSDPATHQRDGGDLNLLYHDEKTPPEKRAATVDLLTTDEELIAYLRSHPETMYSLAPRKFEELVGAILIDMGYDVELTGFGADGGIDIIATQKTNIGETLLIVDCKRYSSDHPVGVGVVRAMFGLTEQKRATVGLLATTSRFTEPAHEFRDTVRHRLSLKDYQDLRGWLQNYRGKGHVH